MQIEAGIEGGDVAAQGSLDDFVQPDVADTLINTIPNCFGIRFPGAGHGVLFQFLDFAVLVIQQFLCEP